MSYVGFIYIYLKGSVDLKTKLSSHNFDPEILETRNRNSNSKYFQVVRIEKQILSFIFWENLQLDNFVLKSTDIQVVQILVHSHFDYSRLATVF